MQKIPYLCNICKKVFKLDVIDKDEAKEAALKGKSIIPPKCPMCGSFSVIRND